jgi:hypothetical protein
MSFLPIKDENKEAPTGQTTNAPGVDTTAPPQTGGSVGEQASGAPPKTSASGSPTQFGSSASKLGDYLSANAPQIGQQAETLAGNLNQQYTDLNRGITDAAKQFQGSVQGGYAAPDKDLVSRALQDPNAFTQNPEDVQAFQKQYNNQYTGPLAFEGTQPYSDIQGKVGQAVQQGNLLGTQAGLESYLKGTAPNPTQAMSSLDALLLRGNPEAQQKVNQAAGQFGNLQNQFGQVTQEADQSVLDAQKAAQDAATYARGQFDPYVSDFNKSIQDQAAQAEAQRQAYNQALAGNQLQASTGRTNLLGTKQAALDPVEQKWAQAFDNKYGPGTSAELDQIRSWFTPDLSKYDAILGAQMNNEMATPANTATADQYQRAQSLAQLLGQNYQSPLDQSTVGYAGSYKAPALPASMEDVQKNQLAQTQKIQDLSALYSSPFGVVNMGAGTARPYQDVASGILNSYANPTSGYGNFPQTPEYMAALQRLAANSYGI